MAKIINEHHAKFLLANLAKIAEISEELAKYIKNNNLKRATSDQFEREEDRQKFNQLINRIEKSHGN